MDCTCGAPELIEGAAFEARFTTPLGEVAGVTDLIETAYEYYHALARHPALGPVRWCDCGSDTASVCASCGGRRLAAAYRAVVHPDRARCEAFLTELASVRYRDASGVVKAALLGGVIKLVGELLRDEFRQQTAPSVPAAPPRSAAQALTIPGKNRYLRSVSELCSSHIGECCSLVIGSGSPIARDRTELWAASVEWVQWGNDYRGEEHYAYADWLSTRPPRPLPGREEATHAQWLLCQALGRGVDSGGRADAPWLCGAAYLAGLDAWALLLGGELINFGAIGLEDEADAVVFAHATVARLAVMVVCSTIDLVAEAMAEERNLFDTVCGTARRRLLAWGLDNLRAPWPIPAVSDVWAVWSSYMWLGPRHRFALYALPVTVQRQVTARWAQPTQLPALRRAQEAWQAGLTVDQELDVPCACCDHAALAREMTAWSTVVIDGADATDAGRLAFVQLLDACGVDACDTWHRSILDRCPSLAARHEVLYRRVAERADIFTAGLDAYEAYLAGAEPVLLPTRPAEFARQAADDLCARYHGRIARAAGVGDHQ
ncbi:hypothetical protein [Kitasatospora viridis]|uniref:hypothetical protein n=1 Tax=Kitasatospora viridis TaxID=281105 RepID=UPI0011A7F313|nr:hypothetical protein [Kitasatospora viridis]